MLNMKLKEIGRIRQDVSSHSALIEIVSNRSHKLIWVGIIIFQTDRIGIIEKN